MSGVSNGGSVPRCSVRGCESMGHWSMHLTFGLRKLCFPHYRLWSKHHAIVERIRAI